MRITKLAAVAALLTTFAASIGPALAGDLDGLWVRDDQKFYAICDADGMQLAFGGDYACRFATTRTAEGRIEWRLRFTRIEDEGGYFETKATSTATFKGAIPAKLDMEFEWVDVDDAGKVTGRGTEHHVIERKKALEAKDAPMARASLAYHRQIDARLEAKDPAGALAIAVKALTDPLCPGDRSIELRKQALEVATAPPPVAPADPAAAPLEVTFLALVPLEHAPASFGKWAASMRIKNVSGELVKEALLALHYLDADGKELDDPFSHLSSWTPALAPGRSREQAMGFKIPEGTKTVRGELREVKLAGRSWKPPVAPEGTGKDPADLVPATVEFVRVSEDFGQRAAKMRITNVASHGITSVDTRLHFVGADGKDLGEPYDESAGFEPLAPGSVRFGSWASPLPEGTKSVRAEVLAVHFADKTTWKSPATH
jgi:hypothetical protein